ncbi:hypothetical protein HUA74_44275 [Myxococcus sp. CA051A]|uniref:hypothetical protein n=1 Tax=unclassified Myxococcus TaxID=2648731 RepID=UPI00157A90C1|nr:MULTISPECIES: hypothetical protein [unclassified Myxococcus]NTX10280.1 hypothetical protein [Myxococcus sp. CA056]NTX67687.1 hypothetical protein [Myxococcus sp. CA051A]
MKKKLLSAVMVCALGLVGCGDDDDKDPPVEAPKLNSSANILAFLEGKTLLMEGANIPSHPNGFSEDVDFGASSQCYQKVTMSVAGGNFKVDSVPGTITDGVCNHDAPKNPLSFTSNTVLIENVTSDGSCFDVTFTFPGGLVQEGRGGFTADQKTLKLEIFFKNQSTGSRCANGAVGAAGTVTLNGQSFAGNAVQTYAVR